MKLIYKPFGIVLGIFAGFLSKRIFDQVWSLIDDREAPKATHKHATWSKVIAAAAVEGVAFNVTRAAVDRAGARSFEHVTGVWPGENAPDDE